MTSRYLPPSSRMRQIRRDAPPPLPQGPQFVQGAQDRALKAESAKAPEAVFVIEEPVVDEPVMEMPFPEVAMPFFDVDTLPEPEVVPPPEPKAARPAEPFHAQMKKSDLVVIAANMGVPLSDEMTKAQILMALKAASGQ